MVAERLLLDYRNEYLKSFKNTLIQFKTSKFSNSKGDQERNAAKVEEKKYFFFSIV